MLLIQQDFSGSFDPFFHFGRPARQEPPSSCPVEAFLGHRSSGVALAGLARDGAWSKNSGLASNPQRHRSEP